MKLNLLGLTPLCVSAWYTTCDDALSVGHNYFEEPILVYNLCQISNSKLVWTTLIVFHVEVSVGDNYILCYFCP